MYFYMQSTIGSSPAKSTLSQHRHPPHSRHSHHSPALRHHDSVVMATGQVTLGQQPNVFR